MSGQDSRLTVIAHTEPEWLIFEGRAYRRSDDFPESPPWTHVDRAASKVAPSANYQGAVDRVAELESAITAACAMRGHPTEDARETLFEALGIGLDTGGQ